MRKNLWDFLREHRYLLPTAIALLTVLTVVLTLVPTDMLGSSKYWFVDKIGHTVLFGLWTFLIGLQSMVNTHKPRSLGLIFLVGLVFGIMIELFQYLLPVNRSADLWDMIFDAVGCLIAVASLRFLDPNR
ncbi:MAG: VanZ family protein [Balneolaceae bacterium]|nr:VanZ family protein [Balneolaceae bacterium]